MARCRHNAAYTLIELLAVVAVIAILAALTLAVTPRVREKRDRHIAQVQLRGLSVAIDVYHAELNEYPPDNVNDPSRPPLFYELTGVSTDMSGRFTSETAMHKDFPASPPFPQKGFRNCGLDGKSGKNFYPDLKHNQYAKDPSGPYANYWFVVLPVRGPNGAFNPIRYVSTNPTNNPNSYDLWAEIFPRNKTIRMDNWSK